ncbi:MAG: hypothetical protein V4558_15940 [Gemmatimonadota bacterium]
MHLPARRLLLAALLTASPAALLAQELVCHAGAKNAAAPTLGRVETWPALKTELFIGPDARATLFSDGSAAIIDRARSELVRIDRKTGQVSVLARKGEGPLEIKAAIAVVAGRGDSVAVIDLGNHRILRATRSGPLATTQPYKFAGATVLHGILGTDLVEVIRGRGTRGKAEAVELNIRSLGADSALALRTVKLSDPPSDVGIFTQTGIGARIGTSQLALATGASGDVNLFGLRSGPDRVVHLEIGAPIPTSSSMATRLVTLASSQLPVASRQAMVSGILQNVPTNPTYPLFSRLVIGTAGNFWVQRTFVGDDAGTVTPPVTFSLNDLSGFRWEQFSPTGARLADCTMPTDWRVLAADAGWVLFAQDDAENTRLFTWRVR